MAAGKASDAIIEYRLAVEATPQAGDIHLALAETYLKVADLQHSVQSYIRAADLLPDRLDVQLKTGTLLLAGGRFDDAKVRAERAVKIAPNDVEAHVLLANAWAGLRNPDAALTQIEEALALDPKRGATYTSLANIEIGRGRSEAAEQAFKRAIELDDQSAAAHLAAGNFYWASGRMADAERELTRGLTLQPGNVIVREILAAFYTASNRPAEVEVQLKKLFELTGTPQSGLALVDFYLNRNDLTNARALLATLKSRADTKNQAEVRLASIDHAAGQTSKAYTQLDEVLANDDNNLDALLAKSSMLLTDRRIDDALAAATLATQTHADSAAAFYAVGKAQTARRQVDAAIAAYDTASRLNPRAAAPKVALAELHLVAGRPQTSLGFAQDVLRAEPENPDARLSLAKGYIASGDLARAKNELEQLSVKYPKSAAILVQQGIILAHQKDAAARQYFEQALQLEPENTQAMSGLVALDLAGKKPEEARAKIDTYLARPNPSADLLMLSARTAFATGDQKTAEGLFRRVIEKDPAYLQAYVALGQLYIVQNKLDSALAEFENLAKRDPRPVAPLTFAGIILQAQGKTKEAQERFERALQIDSSAAVAANNLAWIYSESGGNLDIALQLARTAHSKLPDTAEVSDTLGFIYYKKGLIPQAVKSLREAVDKDPSNPSYHYHLGLSLAKAGSDAEAAQHLNQSLRLKPDFDGAADAKRTLQALPTR